MKAPRFLFVFLITAYQWTLSPDHGIASFYTVGRCVFFPTCSEYTKRTIIEQGVVEGFYKGLQQIRKCH